MTLAWKLFFSYLIVVMVGAGVVIISTAYTAPAEFSHQMHAAGMRRHGQGRMEAGQDLLIDELNADFRKSLNTALFRSTGTAAVAAVVISFLVSRRITKPIRQLSRASQRIVAGSYTEVLTPHSQDELGQLVRSFNQMAANLSQTETMRQHLLADVTHELKTPLASINAYLEGLQDGVLPSDAETFQQIQQEVQRLQRLIQDLQQLSRAEAGQLHLKQETCDAVAITESVVEWLRPQYEEKAIALNTYLPKKPIYFQGDSDRISQVILNLLSNALQYTPSQGTVTVQLTSEKQYLHFAFQDTGIGLSSEMLPFIFMRFYRVDKSRSRESGGSGIGLTIAKYIVEAHGGQIWAESAGLNKGSTFHFTVRQQNFSKT